MRRLSIALLVLLLARSASAATLAGVTLPDQADVNGQKLVLNGMGLRTQLVIKVYVGGLYLPQKETSAQQILAVDGPRRMVMHFIYDVSKDQIKGTLPGEPTADAILATWIGPDPAPGAGFKKAVLGG